MLLIDKIKQKPNKDCLLLTFFIIWGVFLRLYYLGADSLWFDEGFTLAQTDAIYKNFLPLLDSGQYLNRDFLLPYILVLFKYWGASSFEAYRLVSVIFGILCIPLAYKIGKEIFNKNIGLIFSFFISFSYWQVAWSRQIRAYILLELLVLLAFFFLIKYQKTQKKKFLLFFIICTGLAATAKISAIFLLPALLVYFLNQKKYKVSAVIILVSFILGFLGYFYFKHSFSSFLSNYLVYYLIGYFWLHLGLFFPLAIVGAFWAIFQDKYWKSFHFFLFAFFFLNLFFFSFFYYVNQKRYLFILLPIIFLYAASLIYNLAGKNINRALVVIFSVSLFALIDIFSVHSLLFIPQKNFILESYTPQPNFESAYDFLQKTLKPEDSLLSPYPYMDKIYLDRPSYALSISYTGRENDSSITKDKKEYHSGAPEILSIGKINSLRENGDVYIILDTMAMARANRRLVEYVKTYPGSLKKSFISFSGDTINIYRLDTIKEDQGALP